MDYKRTFVALIAHVSRTFCIEKSAFIIRVLNENELYKIFIEYEITKGNLKCVRVFKQNYTRSRYVRVNSVIAPRG